MFGTGVLAGATGLTHLVPLVERDVETMSSSLASAVTRSARAAVGQHDLLLSVHALGGAPYRLMKKGTEPYVATRDSRRAATSAKQYRRPATARAA